MRKEKTNSGYKHNNKVSHGIFNFTLIMIIIMIIIIIINNNKPFIDIFQTNYFLQVKSREKKY